MDGGAWRRGNESKALPCNVELTGVKSDSFLDGLDFAAAELELISVVEEQGIDLD